MFRVRGSLTDRLRFGVEQFLKLVDVPLQQFFGLGPVPQALVAGAATNTPGFHPRRSTMLECARP